VADQKGYPNYHQFDYPKIIDLQEDSQEEDFLGAEDSQEEGCPEEVEDTQEGEAHLAQDPLEVDGDLHQSKYHNRNKANWWEKHPPFMRETGRTRNSSLTNGSCIGG